MTLRRKLLIVFAGLAVLSLLVAGVSLWATLRWEATETDTRLHYQRSLLLQRVRASTFQGLKEVDDGLTGGDHVDARSDFERALRPAGRDFAEWSTLADTDRERAEVADVRAAFSRLVRDSRVVFDLLDRGRQAEAVQLVDDELDTGDVERFRLITEAAVDADRRRREVVRSQVEQVRRSLQIVLLIAALSMISLVLLFAAYLAQDLFKPLRDTERALRDLADGDFERRLDDGRQDEFGAVAAAFNVVATGLGTRMTGSATADARGADWTRTPSRLTLHGLLARLRGRLADLRSDPSEVASAFTEIDALADAVERFAGIGFPLDLELVPTDPRILVHAVLERHRHAISERAISLDVRLSPGVRDIAIDRLKVREAMVRIVADALDALPEHGGLLGMRVYVGVDGRTMIEVADDGRGMDGDMIERAGGRDPFDGSAEPHVGLALARAVVEQHGGTLAVMSEAGRGTIVQLAFPSHR